MRHVAVLSLIAAVSIGCVAHRAFDNESFALGQAVASGSIKDVEAKLGDPNQKVPLGAGSPMHIAAQRGDIEMLRFLISRGGNLELRGGNFDAETPLVSAVEASRLKAVQFLLSKGANPNGLGKNGLTALGMTSDVEVAKCLLSHGADVEVKDEYGSTALDQLVASPRTRDVALYLLEKGARPADLCLPALNGDIELMEKLYSAGAQVNSRSPSGLPPLFFALQCDSTEPTKWLLRHGARVDAVDKYGNTPLHFVCDRRRPAFARVLLNAGASVDATDAQLRTPLALAAGKGDSESVNLLLGVKANLEAKDKNGWTPLFWASANGRDAAVKALLRAGARTDVLDKTGHSAEYWCHELGLDATAKLVGGKG